MPERKPYRDTVPGREGPAAATVIPDRAMPLRKWFAGAVGILALNLLAAVGIDVGAILEPIIDPFVDVDEETIETGARTAIGALAGVYLWPEYLSLPEALRGIVDRVLGRR